jgi:hypothetical protein
MMLWISTGGSRSTEASIALATAGNICSSGVVKVVADSVTAFE